MAKLAKDILPIPASEVPCESAFSSARQTLSFTRSLLSARTLEALMISKYAMKSTISDMRTLAKFDDDTVNALLSESSVSDLDLLFGLENQTE